MVAINVREYGSPVMIIMRSNCAHAGCPVTARSSARQTPDATIPRELRRLRALLPARVALLVVGTTAEVQRASIVDTGATPLVGLAALRARLRELRQAPAVMPRARAARRR